MAEARRVELFSGQDARGTRTLWASLDPDGSLVIEGQDRGPQVQVFGPDFREYEWSWRASAGDLSRIVELLGGGQEEDPLEVLVRWALGRKGEDPGSYLRNAGVPLEFWSRIGD